MVVLDGAVQVETTNGDKRTFGPGAFALVEYVGGKGHIITEGYGNPNPVDIHGDPGSRTDSKPIDGTGVRPEDLPQPSRIAHYCSDCPLVDR